MRCAITRTSTLPAKQPCASVKPIHFHLVAPSRCPSRCHATTDEAGREAPGPDAVAAEAIEKSSAEDAESDEEGDEEGRGNNKLTVGSLVELVGFGLGLPMPASVEFDKERKVVKMEFEANNFDQQYAYRDSSYVDESEDMMVKLKNFFSFGKKDEPVEAEEVVPDDKAK